MTFDHPLWRTFPIVTPDKFEMGLHGMRMPGGYVFWWCPAGGAYLQQFVPMDAIRTDPLINVPKVLGVAGRPRVEGYLTGAPDPSLVCDSSESQAPSDTE